VIEGMEIVDQLYSGYGEDAEEGCAAVNKERYSKAAAHISIENSKAR
jgi:hypothetical protein